jgi:hypothetical protein
MSYWWEGRQSLEIGPALTLIVPGKDKMDPAKFDVKFLTNLLCTKFRNKYLFLQKHLPNLAELQTRHHKITF